MDALSLSSNIVRRGAVYYIRVRVPSDLLDYYAPKKEITYSLKTKDPREAKRKGNLERVKIDQQFAEARRSNDSGDGARANDNRRYVYRKFPVPLAS